MNSTIRGIGRNVSIFHQVTIREWRSATPLIGNNCTIFGGAKIVGGVTVGKNSIIGANVGVSNSIPENSSVSMPELIIRTKENK